MDDAWKFLNENADALTVLLALLPILGGGGWLVRRWLEGRVRGEVNAFEVITDPATLLPKLYNQENNPGVLADHRIPYHARDPSRDLQAELRAVLESSRYLLITGREGVGKTREAATLAQWLMHRDYRVVRVLRTGWLDVPKGPPPELGNDRTRILILLDDLNGLFRSGGAQQSPRAETTIVLRQPSYHDRLLQTLDYFERDSGPAEIRVIATARDEADEWQVLNYDPPDPLWKRFRRVDLAAPQDTVVAELLGDAAQQSRLPAESEDFPAIARRNDGTYRNVVLNLQRLQRESQPLTLASFEPTLVGSWRQSYESALRRHPAVRYLYDAIDLLRQVNVALYPSLVESLAQMIWGGNWLQRLMRARALHRALHYLVREEKVLAESRGQLAPRDGQIEAKGTRLDWQAYADSLEQLVLTHARQQRHDMTPSLMGFGLRFYDVRQCERALTLWIQATELLPEEAIFWLVSGHVCLELGRHRDAEAYLRKAIELDPTNAAAHHDLGYLLDEDPARQAEAEAAYRKAIELNPNDAVVYYNLGFLLVKDPTQLTEAEAAFRKAIELDPSLASAYYNLGYLLDEDPARQAEAEAAYRKAIDLNPNHVNAYNNLGLLLAKDPARQREAEAAFRKAIELNPNDAVAYYNLGYLLDEDPARQAEAEAAYRKAIELNPTYAAAYNNLGLLLAKDPARQAEAEAAYRKAIELNPTYTVAYYNLGYLLDEDPARQAEAEAAYRKAIELDPTLAVPSRTAPS